MENQKSTHEIGVYGENKAVKYLLSQNYTILERNFRLRDGEIDIICTKNKDLIFVEVKHLPKGNPETLNHVLSSKKQKKIINTAKIYLQKNRQYNYRYIRFDVIALDVPGLDPVYHIENAFLE